MALEPDQQCRLCWRMFVAGKLRRIRLHRGNDPHVCGECAGAVVAELGLEEWSAREVEEAWAK